MKTEGTLLLVALVAAASGCTVDEAYRKAWSLRSHLETATTEASLEEVRAAAERLPPADLGLDVPLCTGCLEAVTCEGDSCGIWVRNLHQEVVLVAETHEGRASVRIEHGGDLLGSEVLLAYWDALDPAVAESARHAPVGAGFQKRFTLLGQVGGMRDSGALGGFIIKTGVYHWLSPFLLAAYSLDFGMQSRAHDPYYGGIFHFAPTLRLGLARFGRHSDTHYNFPGPHLYLHGAPILALMPEAGLGWRAGVGAGIGAGYAGFLPFGIFVEGYTQQVPPYPDPAWGLSVTIGI